MFVILLFTIVIIKVLGVGFITLTLNGGRTATEWSLFRDDALHEIELPLVVILVIASELLRVVLVLLVFYWVDLNIITLFNHVSVWI